MRGQIIPKNIWSNNPQEYMAEIIPKNTWPSNPQEYMAKYAPTIHGQTTPRREKKKEEEEGVCGSWTGHTLLDRTADPLRPDHGPCRQLDGTPTPLPPLHLQPHAARGQPHTPLTCANSCYTPVSSAMFGHFTQEDVSRS